VFCDGFWSDLVWLATLFRLRFIIPQRVWAYGAYSGCLVLWGIFLREQFGNLLFFYTCFGGGIGSFSLDGIMMGWSLQRENVIHKRLMGWLGRGQDCQMDRIEISVCSFTHCAHKTFLTS